MTLLDRNKSCSDRQARTYKHVDKVGEKSPIGFYIKEEISMQKGYKVGFRNVPETLKQAMKLRALKQGTSMEKVALEALMCDFAPEIEQVKDFDNVARVVVSSILI